MCTSTVFREICSSRNFVGSKVACLHHGRLLCYLRDNYQNIPDPNLWDFPGGERNEDETALQCAIRETIEEFNINLEIEQFFHASYYKSHQENRKDVAFFVANISAEQISRIKFGSEGQYWELIESEIFLQMPNAVKELQAAFANYVLG